jgi:hypothetical protein
LSVLGATVRAMEEHTEADEFRRIELSSSVERATTMIANYRGGIDEYRGFLNAYFKELGHIAERLGEPEEGGT